MHHRQIRHRLGAIFSATALAATALIASPAVAGEIVPTTGDGLVPSVRYHGLDRFDTAALIATDDTGTAATHNSDTVILARSHEYPDALAGSLMAGLEDAPLLLTDTNFIPQYTLDAMDELEPTKVVLLGGTAAISQEIEDQLKETYEVDRIGGIDRFETAAKIAAHQNAAETDFAIVALGTNFPDALVSGPLAYAAGFPIVLTATDALPEVSKKALTDLGVSKVLIAGGLNAVGQAVEDEIKAMNIATERVRGEAPHADRFGTAAAFADWAAAYLGFSTDHVNLATGLNFPDALAVGPHAGADFSGPAPILLVAPTSLTGATEEWLTENATPDNQAIHVAGGTTAISKEVEQAAREAFTPEGWITPADFAAGVSLENVMSHLQAFQAIADANGGNREASSPGYDASVAYVKGLLDAAGYETTVQPFDYLYFEEVTDTTLAITDPGGTTLEAKDYVRDEDFAIMSYSGSDDVEAPITLVDNLGCETTDFGDLTGQIALIERGECTFATKAQNAENAGAEAVIVFNNTEGLLHGTLGEPTTGEIAAVGTTPEVGAELAQLDGDAAARVRIVTDTLIEERTSSNLIADTPGGDASNVVIAGAHLDSVPEGPGINDNGSGSAVLLETALHLADSEAPINNKVRFAWWGAEEAGLVGSWYYVENTLYDDVAEDLSEEGKAVALYLNFDMVGSPNFARFIYDGDGDTFGIGDAGSGVIEAGFEGVFDAMELAHEPTAFSGRSDYAGFQALGIPSGGLFTGAEGLKTEEQVALYGGEAGVAYDECYHLACDTIENVNETVLGEMLYAIAHEIYRYALSTASVQQAQAAEDGGARAPARASADAQYAELGHSWIR